MMARGLKSLTSHKSFTGLLLYQYSLKRQHRESGSGFVSYDRKKVRAARFLQSARPSLKMRGGITFDAKKHTERGVVVVELSTLPEEVYWMLAHVCVWLALLQNQDRLLNNVQCQVFQWDVVGSRRSQRGVRGQRWLMKHTRGGGLTSLRKSLGIIQWSEVIYSVLKPSFHLSCYYFIRKTFGARLSTFLKCLFLKMNPFWSSKTCLCSLCIWALADLQHSVETPVWETLIFLVVVSGTDGAIII